jgi:hypothetical protein
MAASGGADLSHLLVVVPGRRAGRRLLELLAQRSAAAAAALVPPDIVTVGALPEALGSTPALPVAGEVDETLARLAVLRAATDEQLGALCGRRPAEGRLEDWLELARDLAGIDDELAAEGLDAAAVLRRGGVEEHERRRWRALATIARAVDARLARRGLLARNRARLEATPGSGERTLVLAGVADLGRLFTRLLSGCDVVALVQAPEEDAAAFDVWGCPLEEVWCDRHLDLDPTGEGRVRHVVAHRPGDQVRAVVDFTAECRSPSLGDDDDRFRVHEVSVGVGDPRTARPVAEGLTTAGVPSHSAFGRPVTRSRPARLLAALARLVGGRRFADLAALVRHPDVSRFLDRVELPVEDEGQRLPVELAAAVSRRDWATLLDLYTSATLARRIGAELPDRAPGTAIVKRFAGAVLALLPQDRRPLAAWSAPLLDALGAFYGDLTLILDDVAEAELGDALSMIAEALREQAEAVEAADDDALFDGPQAVAFTLGRLAGIELGGGDGGRSAVEILGWLELPLDDAPALVVTGLNEGVIPQSVSADVFLPDRTRHLLGLLDNRRRYARDLFHLTALVRSRDRLLLVSGRRSAEDEPLAPSRLLLACADAELPERVRSFFAGSAAAPVTTAAPLHERDRWSGAPPPPERVLHPVTELPVTAFRDYLSCPYRFYLRHVLGLRAMRDGGRELDGGGFGGLGHEVLRRFGTEAGSTDPATVIVLLRRIATAVALERFGSAPPPAVRIQLEQLDRRLARFASWQAEQASGGWTVDRAYLEVALAAELVVDGEPFRIVGRIDRVDRHPAGRVRLLDYKTGDRRRPPEEAHRNGDGAWVDLQLPLYALLAREVTGGGTVELGFVHLGRDLEGDVYTPATWSAGELESAWEAAREVVRAVRAERFWPPSEAPPFDDGLGFVCGDAAGGRR